MSSPSSSSPGTRLSASLVMRSITRRLTAASASLQCTRLTSCTVLEPPHVNRIDIFPTCRKMSDGMFLSACRQVAKDFPDISYDEDLLDRACLQVCLPSGYTRHVADRRALDRSKPAAVLGSCDGHAQPLRRDRFQHWRRARWRPWHRAWLQRWQGKYRVLSLCVRRALCVLVC